MDLSEAMGLRKKACDLRYELSKLEESIQAANALRQELGATLSKIYDYDHQKERQEEERGLFIVISTQMRPGCLDSDCTCELPDMREYDDLDNALTYISNLEPSQDNPYKMNHKHYIYKQLAEFHPWLSTEIPQVMDQWTKKDD